MNMEKTGAYLASLRKGRDMTQQQVADILGVSNKTVSKWESGAGMPDIGALPALAALYGVTADDILAGETRPRACGDSTPSEVGLYLEQRSSLRFRICYAIAVLVAIAGWLFGGVWAYLTLAAVVLAVWIGWGRAPAGDALRRRLLALVPLGAAWLVVLARDALPWSWVYDVLPENAGQRYWGFQAVRSVVLALLLLVSLAVLYGAFSAVAKAPLLPGRATRYAAFAGWGLTLCSEIVRVVLCWQPAMAYITTRSASVWDSTTGTYTTLEGQRWQEFYAVYEPVKQVQRLLAVLAVIVCIVLAIRARRREGEN